MKVLITGGVGFIGTALANALHAQNISPTLLDFSEKFSLFHREHFDCISADIRDFETVPTQQFDLIYHLAAQTSGAVSQEEPELDVDTNVRGTMNVCRLARRCGAKKIIFSSSMGVYGNRIGSISEADPPAPISNYGVSKIAGEYYIRALEQFGIQHTIFRLFNVYGPGQDMHNLRQGMASIFLAQAILGTEIKVTGSLERYRDFVYIDDVCKALLLASSGLDGLILNVGSGIKTTVSELIDLIVTLQNRPDTPYRIENIGAHDGDQFGTVSDSSRLRSFGWQPTVTLSDGLSQMNRYAQEILQ